MALDTDNILTSVLNVLRNNTSTIASSITSVSIGKIRGGDAPIAMNQYPAIIVKLANKEEEFDQIGQRNNFHDLSFDIIAMLNYDIGTSESDQEVRKMTRGIKHVLKANNTLSNTVAWIITDVVEYFPHVYDGIFVSAAKIKLKTFQWSL